MMQILRLLKLMLCIFFLVAFPKIYGQEGALTIQISRDDLKNGDTVYLAIYENYLDEHLENLLPVNIVQSKSENGYCQLQAKISSNGIYVSIYKTGESFKMLHMYYAEPGDHI